RKLAAEAGDPWFTAIAEQETAAAEMSHGNLAAAERRLRGAIEAAERERLAYRALALRDQLVKLYKAEQHLAQAAEVARIEFHDAAAAGEGLSEMNALSDLVAIDQNRYASGLFRAYVTEQLERSQTSAAVGPSPFDEDHDCATRQYDFQSLANLALEAFDPDTARTWLSRAPTCTRAFATELMFQRAVYAADLYRLGRREEDAQLARGSLAALRAATLSPPEQAMVEYIEGNLVIDDDRAAGERHLRDAIARADHHTDDAHFYVKARAYSAALLATSAGRAGDFARVLELLAEDLEVGRPPRCAVAIARYAERTVVAASDARGEITGRYAADRRSADAGAATLIPPAMADRLRACDRVVVLTRAPVLGASHLLPPELAWSYALEGATVAPPAAGTRRLVIANPEVPTDLGLPPLGPYPDEAGQGAVVLRGADATPSRVLQAMRDAQVIEFHTHGFIGNDVTESSYLVLSPELDRQYALTATDVAGVELAGVPLVILGACHAAASSQSLEGGIGLAEAFLRSGARAVIASPDAIGDLGAAAFFAAVRERVMQGADPAVALRDERLHRLSVSHDDAWVSGVVVFENLGHASM
ncbi:MAG TPA: CHAT domain-containing protein, partial [Kofleriaceae bacterium]